MHLFIRIHLHSSMGQWDRNKNWWNMTIEALWSVMFVQMVLDACTVNKHIYKIMNMNNMNSYFHIFGIRLLGEWLEWWLYNQNIYASWTGPNTCIFNVISNISQNLQQKSINQISISPLKKKTLWTASVF